MSSNKHCHHEKKAVEKAEDFIAISKNVLRAAEGRLNGETVSVTMGLFKQRCMAGKSCTC